MTSWYLCFSVCFGHDPGESTCGPAVPDGGGSDVHPARSTGKTRAKLLSARLRGVLRERLHFINPEMLQHFSPLLHGNRAIEQKRSLHMSQDIYLIYTTVRRIYGDFCDLCKNKEKLGVHWSNDLLCFSCCTYPEFYQLSLGSLSSLRPQYLSAVTFLKDFAISVQNLWITSGGWVSQINWAKSIAGFCLGGFLVYFSVGKHGRVSSQLFERQNPVVFWINLYLNLYRHIFYRFKNFRRNLSITVKKLWP